MAIGGAALVALLLTACTAPAPDESPTPAEVTTPTPDAGGSTADPAEVAAIQAAVETTMEESNVRAAIVRVMRGDEVVLTQAWGESTAQVPATTDMHFRSGAVSIPMVSTVLLQLVDEGTVALDDKLSEWMPDVPNADKVTLEQLSQMTSGYADYVQDPTFLEGFNRNPFRQWTPEELYTFGASQPLLFEPGTNWGYAHTNYVLLALALEKITGQSMIDLIQERIFDPLGYGADRRPRHARDPPARSARVRQRASRVPAGRRGPAVHRGLDVLEPVVVARARARSRTPTSPTWRRPSRRSDEATWSAPSHSRR